MANHLSNYTKLILLTEISRHSRWIPTKWEISVIIMHQIRHSIFCCAVKIESEITVLKYSLKSKRRHFKNRNPHLKLFTNSTGHLVRQNRITITADTSVRDDYAKFSNAKFSNYQKITFDLLQVFQTAFVKLNAKQFTMTKRLCKSAK